MVGVQLEYHTHTGKSAFLVSLLPTYTFAKATMADFIKDTLEKVPGVDPRIGQKMTTFSGMNNGVLGVAYSCVLTLTLCCPILAPVLYLHPQSSSSSSPRLCPHVPALSSHSIHSGTSLHCNALGPAETAARIAGLVQNKDQVDDCPY